MLSHFSRVLLRHYSPPGSSVHWDSPGKCTRVDYCALLREIFPIQAWNLHLLSPGLADGFFTTSVTWEACITCLLNTTYCINCYQEIKIQLLGLPWWSSG